MTCDFCGKFPPKNLRYAPSLDQILNLCDFCNSDPGVPGYTAQGITDVVCDCCGKATGGHYTVVQDTVMCVSCTANNFDPQHD